MSELPLFFLQAVSFYCFVFKKQKQGEMTVIIHVAKLEIVLM